MESAKIPNKYYFKPTGFTMPPTPPKIMLTHLDWTIQRLEEILKREKTPYFRSAALQRFGLTYEMALKCINSFKNQESGYPENAAFEQNTEWLELVEAYYKIHQRLDVINSGNTEPAYADNISEYVFNNLNRYCLTFQNLYKHLDSLATSDS